MNTVTTRQIGWVSLLLTLPALVFCGAGVLYLLFEMPAANRFLTAAMGTTGGKIFFSPALVLGGPIGCLALNLWSTCRIRFGAEGRTLVVSLSVAKALGQLIFAMVGLLLITLLLTYAFVENFRIVAR